ncbi:autotransporter domain-containing protein [Pontibacterium granulatum]|uniref:autotransporter outer membrane beta-barrel domain-containing protein n=1 Tax=Pontibacterium granulatum TaxID=2036029 RepID=UPI00249C887B|nr:autotransporter domain-containing protein [Pontibacterium granulatum]MDI3326177.1 autotransporter domain-containing protein [Pontibacterium granulatum]
MPLRTYPLFLLSLLSMLFALESQAGHLFTQAGANTPTWMQSGQGISIDQNTVEFGSGGGAITFNFAANSTVPSEADTSTDDWWQWSAGDILRFTVETTTGTYTTSIGYDASCSADACGVTGTSSLYSNHDAATIGSASIANVDSGFTWTVQALSGEFSLAGYRIYFANGTINGTASGALDQSSVVDAGDLGGGTPSTPDIDTGNASYTTSELSNGNVNPVFDGGTLQIADSGEVTTDFTVNATNGTIDSNSNDSEFSGTLSGAGGLTKSGDGTLTLSGSNTYAGGTTVSGGTVQISSDDNLGTGDLTLDGGALASTGTITSSRNIALGAGNGEINTATGTTYTADGTVSGAGGLTKTGNGTLLLSGSNTYTGNTSVSGGLLRVEGSLASNAVTIDAGGTLGGSGTLTGDVTVNGTLAPGSSPGTLTVAGDVTLTAASTSVFEIDGAVYNAAGGSGTYDRIVLTGATSVFTADGVLTPQLRGISAPATNTYTPEVGDSFRIVTTANANGISGEFDSVTSPVSGLADNTRLDVLYGSDFIDLYVTPESFATLVASGRLNAINAATAFDTIRPVAGNNGSSNADAFFSGLYGLNEAQTTNAILQASGEIHAFALNDIRTGIRDTSFSLVNAARHAPVQQNFWVDVSLHNSSFDADSIASAYDGDARHLWVGNHLIDNDNARVGVALGYTDSSIDSAVSGDADIKTASVAAYYARFSDNLSFDATLGIAHSSSDMERSVSLSTGTVQNTSDATTNTLFGSMGVGTAYQLNDDIEGMLWGRMNLEFIDAHGYTESGAETTALQVDGKSYRSAELSLGYRLNGNFSTQKQHGIWFVDLGAAKQTGWNDQSLSRDVSLHNADWEVSTADMSDVTAFVKAGVTLPLDKESAIGFHISGSHSDSSSAHSGNIVFSTKL